MCTRASRLLFFFCALNLCISFLAHSQSVVRKEEPILAGVPDGVASWENKEQPLAESWGNWGANLTMAPNGTVFSITGNVNSSVIVAGAFDSVGDSSIERIAQYNGSWSRLGEGIQNGVVYCTAISDNNLIFAGGTFTMAGKIPVNWIAMWDGTMWHPLENNSSDGTDSTVLALALIGDSLYVGGNFTHAGGKIVNHIAIWNIATDQWEPIVDNGIIGVDGGVAALLVPQEQNVLYVGGGFLHAGTILAPKIANLSQGTWENLSAGVKDTDGIVEALCENSYGPLIVGGHFSTIGDAIAAVVAQWDSYDLRWEPINQIQRIRGTVYCLTNPVDLYIGGNYIDSTSVSNYLVEPGFPNMAPPVNGPVYALLGEGALWGEGYSEGIYVGGTFSTPTSNLALWNEGADVAENGTALNTEISVFPNPVTEHSTIRIQVPSNGFVNLALYNALGERITTFCQSTLDAGSYDFNLSATQSQDRGVFFLVLNLGGIVSTYKLIVK